MCDQCPYTQCEACAQTFCQTCLDATPSLLTSPADGGGPRQCHTCLSDEAADSASADDDGDGDGDGEQEEDEDEDEDHDEDQDEDKEVDDEGEDEHDEVEEPLAVPEARKDASRSTGNACKRKATDAPAELEDEADA